MACKIGSDMQQAAMFVWEGRKNGGVDGWGSEKQEKTGEKKTKIKKTVRDKRRYSKQKWRLRSTKGVGLTGWTTAEGYELKHRILDIWELLAIFILASLLGGALLTLANLGFGYVVLQEQEKVDQGTKFARQLLGVKGGGA